MRRMVTAAALLVACAAGATSMIRQDVAALSRSADAVVRGTVERAESRWSRDRRVIFTEIEIRVAESLKGAPGETVVVRQRGGQVDGVGQRVHGLASFKKGEELVVFLERKSDGSYVVDGMAQGKFRVERSSDGRAVFAVPEDVDARLIDEHTGQPVLNAARPLLLEDLRRIVREGTSGEVPAEGAPVPTPLPAGQKVPGATEAK